MNSRVKNRTAWLSSAPLPKVLVLALVLLSGLWGWLHYRAEARISRATVRLVRTVEKTGAESPVSLGLAANRLGRQLALPCTLTVEDTVIQTGGRSETVQLFAQIRNSMEVIEFPGAVVSVEAVGRGKIRADVRSAYRFEAESGGSFSGRGVARLFWEKGDDGWQIRRAVLASETELPDPGLWP